MVDESSIGPWLKGLKAGEADAMQEIWDRFFHGLVKNAEQKLNSPTKASHDGEDVAASVLESLWRGYQEGRFRDVTNRSQLWWTLLKMTRQKCIDRARHENSQRRGGQTNPVSIHQPGSNGKEILEFLISEAPDPQYVVTLQEQYHECLSMLHDAKQREIAALTIEGYSVSEIAEKLEISKSTVRRKLKIIQQTWQLEARE